MPWIPDDSGVLKPRIGPYESEVTEPDGGGLPVKGSVIASGHDNPDPTFWETTKAALQRENLIGSAVSSARAMMPNREFFEIDDNYNPYQDDELKGLVDNKEYEDRFVDVFNKRAAEAVKSDIVREQKNRRILDSAGWTGLGLQMGAAIADPTILIPGGALVKSGRLGYSAGRTALRVGAAGGVATAAQEGGLLATQQTRTGEEAAFNVAGATILSGLFGAGIAKMMTKADVKKFAGAIEADLADETPNAAEIAETIVQRAQAAGAASIDEINIDDLGVGGPRVAQAIARATDYIQLNPGVQTLFSPSAKVRKIYSEMVDNPVYTKMNMEGRALGTAVENRVKYWQRGVYSSWLREARDLQRQAKKAGQPIPTREFMDRVGQAMRRGDVDENEFVTKAARSARAKINDPLLREAQAIGLLPEDVKVDTAQSYFHRMWNVRRLEAEEFRFKEIARNWIGDELDRVAAKEPTDSSGQRFLDANDRDAYVEEVVDAVYDKLTGRAFEGVQDWMIPVTRGPLKERTFRIPDELVEDFLEDDAEVVMRRYTRTMGAEVELAGKFGRADMRDQLAEIRQEYSELRKEANADTSLTAQEKKKKIDALNKAEKRDRTNLEAFRDLIRGTYGRDQEISAWGPITRLALAWNYMRLLGGVTLTSVADAMRHLGVHGLRATMSEALPQLAKGIKGTSLSINEAKELGAVTETILNSRLASLAEIADPYAYGSKFERSIDNATRVFSKLTGLGYWNDAMKGIASVMTQNRILRNAGKTGLDKHEKAYMAYLGLDGNMSGRIAKMYKKHGQKDGTALVANSHQWEDIEARRAYAAALNKDVDRTIVTKGVADQPLWTRSNWGRIISQFKSFALASHQRVLIAGLQERPHRFAEMLVGGTVLGMMIAYLKHFERGDMERANALLENPGLWVSDGLDRTGMLSVLFEVSNTMEKLGAPAGIRTGLQAVMGDDRRDLDVSRYSSRGRIGAVGGPSVGLFEDLATFAGQMSQGDLKKSGVNAAIRQVPYTSLPGVKTGIYVGARPYLQELVE